MVPFRPYVSSNYAGFGAFPAFMKALICSSDGIFSKGVSQLLALSKLETALTSLMKSCVFVLSTRPLNLTMRFWMFMPWGGNDS